MRPDDLRIVFLLTGLLQAGIVAAQSHDEHAGHAGHGHTTGAKRGEAPADAPLVPEDMTLDEVLDYAARPPPENFPHVVPDDHLYRFTLVEQLEYRVADDGSPDHFGWEAQGWIGGDLHRFWWKSEGEAAFEGSDSGESETDLLYARLVHPFWSVQAGLQYANDWGGADYEDRWSAVVALQGMAPYRFELDGSLYLSEDGDVTLVAEAEYDLRITQRLVLQPRAEIGLSAQDIDERGLGSGVTDLDVDLRLRYEFRRELAPYLFARYARLIGETADIAKAADDDTGRWYYGAGIRFAF